MLVATEGVKGLYLVDFMDLKILTWNVRGLGNRDKRVAVYKGIGGVSLNILVLQESKIEEMSNRMVAEIWGPPIKEWLALPFGGASGGILIIWNGDMVEIIEHEIGAYSIMIRGRLLGGLED